MQKEKNANKMRKEMKSKGMMKNTKGEKVMVTGEGKGEERESKGGRKEGGKGEWMQVM